VTAQAEIVCVGTELLSGKVNTHTSTLSRALAGIGIEVAREQAVIDSLAEIRDAVRGALERRDIVLVTGGLGPTFDDLTREACAEAVGVPLVYRPDLYEAIKEKYLRVYRRIPKGNQRQAFVLKGAKALANRFGSAPGQLLRLGEKTLVLFPGPPWELEPMLQDVLPALQRAYARSVHARKTVFHLCGVSESAADEKLAPLVSKPKPGVEFTILARHGLVDFHVGCKAGSAAEVQRLERWAVERVRSLVGSHVYGTDGASLEAAVGELLRARRWKLSTAESCTGGLLSAKLTEVPGSSDFYAGGVIAYANDLKLRLLGVRDETLRARGAVSEDCAREMAEGARERLGANLAVSITGIAGPSGATPGKPVGLVFIALAREDAPTAVTKLELPGSRDQVRERAAVAALSILRASLLAK